MSQLMGMAVSMPERPPGLSRWREGLGVGVAHITTIDFEGRDKDADSEAGM